MRGRGRVDDSPGTTGGAGLLTWAATREVFVDNLKVLLVAAVIAGHALMSYTELDWWSYADVRETTVSPVTVGVLFAVVLPFALLVVPLLFLVAGLLTPPSLERKGAAGFARDRLVRLGVPFGVFALLLWPLLEYGLFRVMGHTTLAYPAYLGNEGTLDTGVLWFIGALLVFSLVYAGSVQVRGTGPRGAARELGGRHLLVLAGATAATAFLLRVVVPFEADTAVLDLNVYQWPASAALFALGVSRSGAGWLRAVPDRLSGSCRTATLVTVAAFGAFAVYGLTSGGVDGETWTGGWTWPALAFASLESGVAVFGSVWLLAAAQRHLHRPFRWATPAIRRSAYGAFMLQGVVLFGLALLLRPVPVPAEVKAVAVAAAGVAGSFALAWVLINRVKVAARAL